MPLHPMVMRVLLAMDSYTRGYKPASSALTVSQQAMRQSLGTPLFFLGKTPKARM